MTNRELLINKIQAMPDELVERAIAIIGLLQESKPGLETYLLSESALKKTWLSEEEDEAWKDL